MQTITVMNNAKAFLVFPDSQGNVTFHFNDGESTTTTIVTPEMFAAICERIDEINS